jgi:hypothetical protein
MNELWRTNREMQLRGWRLATRVTIGLCCRVIVPTLQIAATRQGRKGTAQAILSVARTPPCANSG